MKWYKSRWLQKPAIKKNVRNSDSLGFWFGGKTAIFGGERKHKRSSLKALPSTEAVRRCGSTVTFSWW